ncbi:hypothetical protein K435DRAFT_716844 [Dendrothele bispora CBS 962.96]|uniref:Uncharacterized protein n=1 Tax=Dendrothele bispora (strain CBS 962.96) TaxID=1314807 RepID=A0A4S8MIU0_DENBC|nr:hypothetical protein K435DRAFT_716844 [Dendrothele bispora CBS 962.96]
MSKYSLKGEDFPRFLPNKLPSPVLMKIEETVHYLPPYPEAETEWIYNSPLGTGSYRFETDSGHRLFFVMLFHQFHCLRRIENAFNTAPIDDKEWWHLEHCYHLLRQTTLCEADMTLEEGDFVKRNFTERPFGAVHVCRDWDWLYDEIGYNYLHWRRYMRNNNLTAPEFLSSRECKMTLDDLPTFEHDIM